MIYSQPDLLKLIYDTHAVSIWENSSGPVFWYAANVPGPFYVNTEMVIGASLSERLLREITAIVVGTVDAQTRARQLDRVIMDAYKATPSWQRLIATMIARAHDEFLTDQFTIVSGGERRDWLFSIPFAHATALPHLFLFKNGHSHCEQALKAGENVLHVSDLINNAASFFDFWQPAFSVLRLECSGNLCVNLRGQQGLQRLNDAEQKTVALVTIDKEYFRLLHAADLISRAVFEEVAIFFLSSRDWASRYLLINPTAWNVKGCDAKSFERLRHFVALDPWELKLQHRDFFATIQEAIDLRLEKAA